MLRDRNRSIIISYIALRRLIGILGILLPFICVLGGFVFAGLAAQESVSFYYHTNMRDFFVGLLMCLSMFLITYKGYERIDSIVNTISGIFSLGIAVFPCILIKSSTQPVGIFQMTQTLSNKIHLVCALVFFILLAINSMFLFTLSKDKNTPKSRNKKIRNFIYVLSGIIILTGTAILFIINLAVAPQVIKQYRLILIIETVMLFSFGISWLIKGETLFRDKPHKS